ncbi:hypothetical protein [Aeromicrobium sp. Leaf272]
MRLDVESFTRAYQATEPTNLPKESIADNQE